MLEEIGQIVTGKTPSSNVIGAFSSSGIPFVTPKDMDGRRWIETTERYLSEAGRQSLKNYLVPKDGVAVSCIGSDMGKAILLKKDSVTNQQINTIIVDASKHNPKYIYYVLSLKQEELKSIAGGSATPILNKGHFSKVVIELPDKVDQDNIVQVLDSLDCKIELNNQINQNLESMAQAIFKSWFIDFEPVRAKIAAKQEGKDPELAAMCTISGKSEAELEQMAKEDFAELQATAALFPDELVDSELGEVPKGWVVGCVGSISTVKGGYAFKSSQFLETGYPVIKIKNILGDGSVDITDTQCIEDKTAMNVPRFVLTDGNLVMAMTGATVGKIGLINTYGKPVYLNQRVAKFESNIFGDKISYYLFCLFNRKEYFEQIVSTAQGSAQPNISSNGIESIKIVVPSSEIITKFLECTDSIFQYWLKNGSENNVLNKVRDTLLPKLLSGELDVSGLQGEGA